MSKPVEEAQEPTLPNAGRDPEPAILSIATLFVTCPSCSHDIPISTPDGETTDWSAAAIAEFDGETDPAGLPNCPECGQLVTINLPKSLPVNP